MIEFDSITAYGATITTIARRPIGLDRGRQKGIVVDLDSSVEFETDVTMEVLLLFAEGFMFAEYANVEFDLKETYGTPSVERPPRVDGTNDEFDIDAASATLAGKVQFGSGVASLLFAKGYSVAANNGLHALDVDLTSSQTAIGVATDLEDETSPPANATLEVVGLRTDDLTLTVNADLVSGTLVSAADVDWTTTGLQIGQAFGLGSPDSAGVAQNAPTIASTSIVARGRITAITATTLTFDKGTTGMGAGGAGSSSGSETVDVMYGRFLRDRPVTSDSTDDRYQELTWQFEGSYPGLASNGTDTEYEYAIGNFANSLEVNTPLTDKATVSVGFIGTNSDAITGTRKTARSGALSAVVAAGGSGYTDTDTLTVVGGTGTAATFTATVVAGAVTAVALLTAGDYTVVPTNPATTSGGTGTGCTLTITYTPLDDPSRSPLRKAGFATGPGISSITTDVTSSASEVCFKSLTTSILNNVSPEKCLGTLGARFVNAGLFQVDLEGQMLFTNKSIVNSIRDNSTVTFGFELSNEDGVVVFDVPTLTLSGGGREFPVDQSVLVNITGASFTSNTFGFNLSMSFFGAAPGVLATAA